MLGFAGWVLVRGSETQRSSDRRFAGAIRGVPVSALPGACGGARRPGGKRGESGSHRIIRGLVGQGHNFSVRKTPNDGRQRCHWAKGALDIRYHDAEWGVPLHDDRGLFEFLILEGAQAGLSWATILQKRENYRQAFDRFDPAKVAGYDKRKVRKLLADAGIVRNRLKIAAAITNARAFLAVREEFGSFDRYVWSFVGGKPKDNTWRTSRRVPVRTPESDALSKDLKKRGFRFVGSTICYAFMQAVGMVNDHTANCFRRNQIRLAK
jgi:DNA-3-methyladenine glycosylase I